MVFVFITIKLETHTYLIYSMSIIAKEFQISISHPIVKYLMNAPLFWSTRYLFILNVCRCVYNVLVDQSLMCVTLICITPASSVASA